MRQLELPGIVAHAFRQHARAVHRYCAAHRREYLDMARAITPDHTRGDQVWARFAFAILSANVPFKAAVDALAYATAAHAAGEPIEAFRLVPYGMVPAKADYLNALPADMGPLLRGWHESWHAYRLRLQRDVKGLGLAKASFAAALLYPTVADVACVDTHMQRVYLGHQAFHKISRATYLTVEAKVRAVGRRHGVSTFLAQWMIWDHARGRVENHAIFPGQHKDAVTEPWENWT